MATSGWIQIYCALTDASNSTPYFLTVNGTSSGSAVVLNSSAAIVPNNMWMLTYDNANVGRIRSLLNNGLVLTCDVDGNLTVATEIYPTPLSQQWALDTTEQIIPNTNNVATGIGVYQLQNVACGYLAAVPASGGAPNYATNNQQLLAGQNPPSPWPLQNYRWCLSPNTMMCDIVQIANYNDQQFPLSFPQFSAGDQQTAYSYISNQIISNCNGDIRLNEYKNLTNSWSQSYTTAKGITYTPDSGVSNPDDFNVVLQQLTSEVQCLSNIQQFNTIVTALTEMYAITDTDTVATCIANSQIKSAGSTNVGTIFLNMLETIGLSVLSGAGEGAGTVAAGLIQAGITAAQQANNAESWVYPPGPMAAADLDAMLYANLKSIFTTVGNMVTACQTDWNKMQVLNLLTTSPWPVSFQTTALTSSQYLQYAQNGIVISAMQSLMPAQWQIYSTTVAIPDDCPASAQYGSKYVSDVQNGDSYPTDGCMSMIWNAGVSKSDFFNGNNGWYLGQPFNYSGSESTVMINIANLTPNNLEVNLYYNWLGTWTIAEGARTSNTVILPNETAIVEGMNFPKDTTPYRLDIIDKFSGSSSPCIQVYFSMTDGVTTGGYVVDFSVDYNDNPTNLKIPITYGWEASFHERYSGAAVIPVCVGA